MAKRVFYDDDARRRILAGAEALYRAVKVTYGPKGGNVVIGNRYYGPSVTHDGVTVAQHVELEDGDDYLLGQRIGAELIKEAAGNLNKLAGDGTTTVTILTYHILKEANRLIAAGHNPQELRKGIEEAAELALKELASLATPVESDSDRIKQIATISAGDKEIGEILAETFKQIGKDGTVTVEVGQGVKTEAEVVEGFSFDTGWMSPLFVTDTTRQEAVYEDVAVVILSKRLGSLQDIAGLIMKIVEAKQKEILFIVDDIDKEALGLLIQNKLNENFSPVVVKAPAFGESRLDILKDIAVFTNATVIDDYNTSVGLEVVGQCRKVVVEQGKTTIIDGAGSPGEVLNRIKELKERKTDTELERHRLDKRAAALSGQVAIIKVGGATETEIEERKYRVDDAVAAVQAALAEGIVCGGGITLLHLSELLYSKYDITNARYAGAQVLRNALQQPFVQIMTNAGLRAEALLEKAIEENANYDKPRRGVDISNDSSGFVNLLDVGVVDPVRVTKETIKNSVSIAATAATMGALVVDLPEKTIANNA